MYMVEVAAAATHNNVLNRQTIILEFLPKFEACLGFCQRRPLMLPQQACLPEWEMMPKKTYQQ